MHVVVVVDDDVMSPLNHVYTFNADDHNEDSYDESLLLKIRKCGDATDDIFDMEY